MEKYFDCGYHILIENMVLRIYKKNILCSNTCLLIERNVRQLRIMLLISYVTVVMSILLITCVELFREYFLKTAVCRDIGK